MRRVSTSTTVPSGSKSSVISACSSGVRVFACSNATSPSQTATGVFGIVEMWCTPGMTAS